jgi:two-component system response regulator YesN
MSKILIVDDERIIREGIAQIIPWEEHGFTLVGTAASGLEAYEIVSKEAIDIIITDIKMPGMNGLQLISKLKEEKPELQFIVLSGYGEFEFARTAMQYGVKYYLLKPCNEREILEVLEKVCAEIKQQKLRDAHITKIKNDLEKVMPQLKAQVLKEFVTNKLYDGQQWEYYKGLFGIEFEGQPVRLILCQVEGVFEFEYNFACQRVAEKVLGEGYVLLSTTIGEEVLLLIKDLGLEKILPTVDAIKKTFYEYYERDMTIAISGSGDIKKTPILYREASEYLKYRFYLGEGSIITKKDINTSQKREEVFIFDYEQLGYLIKSGNIQEVNAEIDQFFLKLGATTHEMNVAKIHCLELFSTVIRFSKEGKLPDYLRKMVDFEEFDTLEQIHCFIQEIALEIAEVNYQENAQRYCGQIKKAVTLINENLHREELTLKWLAHEMLYMNVDYLGKLFKKEMGEKFSDYIIRIRMEKAKNLIETSDQKVFEIAKQVGFGDNPQYFSQVFKKNTGYTPSEYRKFFTGVRGAN